MKHCLTWSLALIFCLPLACSTTGSSEDPVTPWNTEKCVPGTLRGCTCGEEPGVESCDLNGLWGACDCSGDVVIEPDAILAGDVKTTGPSKANLPATVLPVSGVGRLKSEHYELQLIIGPTSPVSAAQSEHYTVQLGPIGGRNE